MQNKNILILSATLKNGGAERVISLLLKELGKDKSINIYLVLMEKGIAYELPDSIKPIILSNSRKNGIRKLLELPIVAYQLSNIIKKYKTDVVLSFLYRPNYVSLLAKVFGAKHKSIINIRSTTSRYLNEGLLGKINLFLIKSLFNKADLIISNSKGVDEDLKSIMHITTDTKVIHNPVDIEYINAKIDICKDIAFDFKDNIQYIISVGRLIPLKRNEDLIDAFSEIQRDNPALELIFVGDGILKKELIDYCKQLSIHNKVHFLGNVSNPFYYLNRSDLFVMTSEIEGFPNVLVEAMACGLPVISSDCKSGPREIIKDETYGLLYPVGDVNILIDKMNFYLYDNIDRKTIITKYLDRLEDFKIDKIMRQFKEVL